MGAGECGGVNERRREALCNLYPGYFRTDLRPSPRPRRDKELNYFLWRRLECPGYGSSQITQRIRSMMTLERSQNYTQTISVQVQSNKLHYFSHLTKRVKIWSRNGYDVHHISLVWCCDIVSLDFDITGRDVKRKSSGNYLTNERPRLGLGDQSEHGSLTPLVMLGLEVTGSMSQVLHPYFFLCGNLMRNVLLFDFQSKVCRKS